MLILGFLPNWSHFTDLGARVRLAGLGGSGDECKGLPEACVQGSIRGGEGVGWDPPPRRVSNPKREKNLVSAKGGNSFFSAHAHTSGW